MHVFISCLVFWCLESGRIKCRVVYIYILLATSVNESIYAIGELI